MPQSLANLLVHAVFSTSDRRPLIPEEVRPDLYAYAGGILRNLNCQPVQLGGVADRVHVLFRLGRTLSLAEAMEKVKSGTSKWIKTKEGIPADFRWQAGYGAFSVSPEHEARVGRYIQEQETHHRSASFQDELRDLLREAGLEYDERYLWD
jgi:putative transposase